MLTRKDYKAIANILNDQQADFNEGDDGKALLNIVAHQLSHYMAQDNPRFNRSKFLEACGVN
jgi:hypothetical protein